VHWFTLIYMDIHQFITLHVTSILFKDSNLYSNMEFVIIQRRKELTFCSSKAANEQVIHTSKITLRAYCSQQVWYIFEFVLLGHGGMMILDDDFSLIDSFDVKTETTRSTWW